MATTGGTIVWNLDLESSKFDSGLKSASNKAKDFSKGLDNAYKSVTSHIEDWSQSASVAINRYTKMLGVATLAASAFSIRSAADYEQSRISFDVMLGSAEKGSKMLSELSDFARKTPFNLPEVVQGAKSLLAYNIEAEKILPTFSALGSIAAGVGKDKLPQLVLAFGQVRTAQRLTGMELRQFTEAGVPLLEGLANVTGKTARQIKEDMENNIAPSFDDVEKAIFNMSKEGGRFFGLLERQSKTFNGTVSNIQDNIGRLARSVVGISDTGDIREGSIFARLTQSAERLLKWIDANKDKITGGIQEIVDKMITSSENFIKEFAKNIKSDGFASAVTESLISLIGKVDWSRFTASAISLLVAVAPDIVIGFVKGLIKAATENPLDFFVMFAVLGFTPAIITSAFATVLGGIPIIGPLAGWMIRGFAATAAIVTAPISAIFGGIATSAMASFTAVMGKGIGAVSALLATPMVMPAIVVVAALASLATVTKAAFAVRDAIFAVNDAAKATANLAPEAKMRELQQQAASYRAVGATVPTSITNALKALGGNALGTSNWKGGATVVGERGPEIVNLPRGSEIIPNHKIGNQGSSAEYNIGTINISSEADGERWLKKLTRNQEIFDNGLTPARNAF